MGRRRGSMGVNNGRPRGAKVTFDGFDSAVVDVACTRGQDGCKGGMNPKDGGHEGPHTIVVTELGSLYTFGTCHKGLLANLGAKTGAFGKPWDEMRPYKIGGRLCNGADLKAPPISPFAVWPPPYDRPGPFVSAVSAHIHCAALVSSMLSC
jgi:hypothetical protein